jgi:alkylhydroperoxidase/carboxymuconolactone decarboxylase family protein YurZ
MQSELGIGGIARATGLNQKTCALVHLGVAMAIAEAPTTYQAAVEAALASGASNDEIVATLVAVAPLAGFARVVSIASQVGAALGYDVDGAIEGHDGDGRALVTPPV